MRKGKSLTDEARSGSKFFHVPLSEPKGNMALMNASLEAFNHKAGEGKGGGAGGLAKMLFSHNNEKVVFVCHVPAEQQHKAKLKDWFNCILTHTNGKKLFSGDVHVMKGEAPAVGMSSVALRDSAILAGFHWLQDRSLVDPPGRDNGDGDGDGEDEDGEESFPDYFDVAKINSCLKEGQTKGSELARLAQDTAVKFFHVSVHEACGNITLMETCLEGVNRQASHLAKVLLSCNEDKLTFVCHVPSACCLLPNEPTAGEWFGVLLAATGGSALPSNQPDVMKGQAVLRGMGTPVQQRDTAIEKGYHFLRSRKLVFVTGAAADEDDDMDEFPEYEEAEGVSSNSSSHGTGPQQGKEASAVSLDTGRVSLGGGDKRKPSTADSESWALAWHEEAAKKGDVKSMLNLAECYLRGEGIAKDERKALEWLVKAANQGHVQAKAKLGRCYREGVGGKMDGVRALGWFLRAALANDPDSQFDLGRCFEEGLGVDPDLEEALKWYEKAANNGLVDGQLRLGSYFADESTKVRMLVGPPVTGTQSDEKMRTLATSYELEALHWYQQAANEGNAVGMYKTGVCFHHGVGVAVDSGKAIEMFRLAANEGVAAAQNNLGYCYQNGIGVKKNLAVAADWYQMAAGHDMPAAMTNLSICYRKGLGVAKDMDSAIAWLKGGAELGDTTAQAAYAQCFVDGVGVEKDLKAAAHWFKEAAEQGDAQCQYIIGQMYEEGEGVEQDLVMAFEWYNVAAQQDLPDALFSLGICYHHGTGVAKDENEAVRLYRRAAELGAMGGVEGVGVSDEEHLTQAAAKAAAASLASASPAASASVASEPVKSKPKRFRPKSPSPRTTSPAPMSRRVGHKTSSRNLK